MSSFIKYEEHLCCPVCGSTHFVEGCDHRDMVNSHPFRPEDAWKNEVITFRPALCENCGVAFNVRGMSNETRSGITANFNFIKPSSTGSSQFQHYVDTVAGMCSSNQCKVLDIGGYDGYLLRELSRRGFKNLTLVDPSTVTDGMDESMLAIRVVTGYFPDADPVWQARMNKCGKDTDATSADAGNKSDAAATSTATAGTSPAASGTVPSAAGDEGTVEDHRLYDVVGCKDVLQMVPDPVSFMRGLNNVMVKGGRALFISSPLHFMHAVQSLHLGANAYHYIARMGGFTMDRCYMVKGNGYMAYELTKAVDIIDDPEAAERFMSTPQLSDEEFEAEQARNRELIKYNLHISQEAAHRFRHAVEYNHTRGREIVIYGTGFYSFSILDSLGDDLSRYKFTMVNSTPEMDGLQFLRPDNKVEQVYWADSCLKDRHVPLLVLAIGSRKFYSEIIANLARINCTFDEAIYLSPV